MGVLWKFEVVLKVGFNEVFGLEREVIANGEGFR